MLGLSCSRQAPKLQLLSCGTWTLSCGMHVRSSSLTRDRTRGTLLWERGVLSTAPLRNSLFLSSFLLSFFPSFLPSFLSLKLQSFKIHDFLLKIFSSYNQGVYNFSFKSYIPGTYLGAQCLRLCASNAAGMGSIPGWGAKIPHAAQPKKFFSKIIFLYYWI